MQQRRETSPPLKWIFEAYDSSTVTGRANRNCYGTSRHVCELRQTFAMRGLPLRCSLTALIFARGSCWDKSASTSGDRAGYSQSGEGKGDNYVPEHPILFTSDSGAEKQDAQKQELELEDSKKYSKHPPPPCLRSLQRQALYPGKDF